jgi:hypothetical protein
MMSRMRQRCISRTIRPQFTAIMMKAANIAQKRCVCSAQASHTGFASSGALQGLKDLRDQLSALTHHGSETSTH